ncbi:MAG: hypothetical protein ACOX6F_02085 [Syntrophomonadaceae bacterium]|jgi:hypothetical protein|nr:hypothetical protein [Syntrophomonadaceae bacterium]HQA49786.1 hypothetical protein [Syntrophomonadaceae bacterium]HQD90928.1 hypothetical protein [Syntrophomonadaceae bacterium]
MFQQNRREMVIITVIITIAFALGLFVASSRDSLNIHYPDKFAVLDDADFDLAWRDHELHIGSTPGETVMEYYPFGYMLGFSTIFTLNEDHILLTFTEDENILHRAHIENPALPTYRGIRVNDPFDLVVEQYGEQYAWVDNGNPDDFDAVYGSDNSRCIIFQVRQGLVRRIVLQNDPLIVN